LATDSSPAKVITPNLSDFSASPVRAAFEAGRNPDVLTFTSGGNGAIGSRALDEVGELAAMGVTRVVLPSFLFWQDTEEALARYGAEIIAKAP
jgi:hypothetical protein